MRLSSIEIRDLTGKDIHTLGWSGAPTHLSYVAAQVARADRGEVDFLLAVVDGQPVGKGAIDYVFAPNVGKLMALVVHPEFRSRGIGSAVDRGTREPCTFSWMQENSAERGERQHGGDRALRETWLCRY